MLQSHADAGEMTKRSSCSRHFSNVYGLTGAILSKGGGNANVIVARSYQALMTTSADSGHRRSIVHVLDQL